MEQRKNMLSAFKGTGSASGAKHFPAICDHMGKSCTSHRNFQWRGHEISLGHQMTKGTQSFCLMCFLTWNKMHNPVITLRQFPAANRGKHHADSSHPSGEYSK